MGLTNSVAANLRKPSSGIIGRFVVKRVFKRLNVFMELNAVRLCYLEPHHHVLEVGFGPGIGLKAAAETIVDGKIYGIDFSPEMVHEVNVSLKSAIASGKLKVDLGDAACLPYPDATIDRIYHCNCYYFWPEPTKVAGELYRVLKPGGFMVTTLKLDALLSAAKHGFLPQATCNVEPEPYMEALRSAGFADVTMEDLVHESANKEIVYQAILAHKKE